ncbi:MAG: hypothetical protein ABC585_05750 [Candidatus Methanosuratincola petrocarbonis]
MNAVQTAEVQDEEPKAMVKSKYLALAVRYGLVVLGWTVRDYMLNAVKKGRYCTVHVWGEQGSMKSNLTLQMGSWVYGEWAGGEWYPDWDAVLRHLVFRPGREERGLIALVNSIPYGEREAWVGWDDLGVHYPSTIYKTDLEKYQAIDSAFAAIRTKISTFTTNNPLIDRVAKNIKDNISIEVFIGPNQTMMAERLCRIPSFDKIDSHFFKVPIEGPRTFDYTKVPGDVWKEYWELRLRVADEAIQLLDQAYSEESDLVPLADVLAVCSPSKLVTYAGKGVVTIVRKGGAKFVSKDDFELLKRASQDQHRSKKVA